MLLNNPALFEQVHLYSRTNDVGPIEKNLGEFAESAAVVVTERLAVPKRFQEGSRHDHCVGDRRARANRATLTALRKILHHNLDALGLTSATLATD